MVCPNGFEDGVNSSGEKRKGTSLGFGDGEQTIKVEVRTL